MFIALTTERLQKNLHPNILTKLKIRNARKQTKYMEETPMSEINASGIDFTPWYHIRHCCGNN